MRRIPRLLALLALAVALGMAVALNGLSPWPQARADTYTIQPGDTLWEIANRLQVGLSVLLALNEEITSPNSIYVGQSIQVPDNVAFHRHPHHSHESARPTPPPASTGSTRTIGGAPFIYVVQGGDTLSQIADTHGTDTDSIVALNPGLTPHLIRIGEQITIRLGTDSSNAPSTTTPERSLNAGITTPSPATSQTLEYVVQSGDGLWGIADNAGISIETLKSHNPQLKSDVIHPGQILFIPVPDHRAPALDPSEAPGSLTEIYTVRRGDTASAIADSHGLTLSELRQLNPSINLNTIYVGQQLAVPWTGAALNAPLGTVPAVEVRRRTYVVESGDNFTSIAARNGLTLDELRGLNPSKPNDLLIVGETLFLPGTIDPPIVSEERTLGETDLVQYAAASLGVTPDTLLANHPWIEPDQWLTGGTFWRLPTREGLLVTVQRGDTLRDIAARHGVDMADILADPAHGVDDPNALVIGQEIIVPLRMPDFIWPGQGELTDPFGQCRSWDCSYRHRGLDMAIDFYEPIVAAADGVVTFVGGDELLGLGWYVEIDHGDGWLTVYAHLIEFAVWQGQEISQGDVVGYNGSTGYSTGPHLHFEVQHNNWYVDPLVVLP